MATVVMTTRIDRAPADVFAVLADVSKNTTWSKTSISGRLLSPPPVGLGSTAREVSQFMGRRIEVDSTVVAYDSGRTFSFVTSSGPFPFRGSFTTEPDGAGTRAHLGVRGRADRPPPVRRWTLRRLDQTEIRRRPGEPEAPAGVRRAVDQSAGRVRP